MKNLFYLFFLLLTAAACTKGDDNTPAPEIKEIDKLPPATQTGANKVGSLVNGKAFLPKGTGGGITKNPYCGYYFDEFVLTFADVKNDNNIPGYNTQSLRIGFSGVILEANKIYMLRSNETNKYADFRISNNENTIYSTNEVNTGELHITKLDKTNNIISGTFWFDAVNAQGKKVEIREGRFDMTFEGWAG